VRRYPNAALRNTGFPVFHRAKYRRKVKVMWDLAWGVGATAYVIGSLVNGMLDPGVGVALVAAGGVRVAWDLWRRYRS
jgi:hypothetical protein